MIRVETEAGSEYLVDYDGMRIQRVHGVHGPTKYQGEDGQWSTFHWCTHPTIGSPLQIAWTSERMTVTSCVTEYEEVSSADPVV